MKKALLLILLAALSLSIPVRLKQFTYGFKIAKLRLELPYSAEWETPSSLSDEAVARILSQPFYFLGKGAQCYAFASSDDRYVLKLFRFDQRKGLGPHWIQPRKDLCGIKVRSFLSACKLGWELAREETALVYLHLNLTSRLLPTVSARTPIGRTIRLPLDGYRFALQKKAERLEETLFAARTDGKLPQRIDAMISLLVRRTTKGIGNRDPSLWRNFGFIGEEAVEIDFGNYVFCPEFSEQAMKRRELERYALPLRVWLKENAPECLAHFDGRMSQV